MRVLQAMAGARPGGAEAFFARLCGAFREAEVEQHILVRRDAKVVGALAAAGLAPETLPFGGFLDTTSGPQFRRAVATFKPDIVLTWLNRASRFCPSKSAVRSAGAEGFTHVGRLGGYYKLSYYRRCDHLIGNTRDIVDYIQREGWQADRVHYLPNFVTAKRDALPPPRESLQTPLHAPLLLALGRLHENKGFDVLLRALAELHDCYLWLAGAGPLETRLRAQVRRFDLDRRVRFLGWRNDVSALFRAADLFVCPSRLEPLGNVVIEAWAHGKPVIAAAAKGPSALIEDGVNGVLVPVDDSAALVRAVRRLLADPPLAASLAAAGTEAYEAEFTQAAVVERYLGLFDRITS